MDNEFKISAYVSTNAGNSKKHNEDNYNLNGVCRKDFSIINSSEACDVSDGIAVFAVCDGMGGESHGDEASLIASNSLHPYEISQIRSRVEAELRDINTRISDKAAQLHARRMGSTAVILYTDGVSAIPVNVGDSRCYLYRDGVLRQITVDHNEATHKISMGLMTVEEARRSKDRHMLTQYLGVDPEEFTIEPYFGEEVKLKSGDRFLLCSDGINDMLDDEEIARILGSKEAAKTVADELINKSLQTGGRDNVTAMIIDILGNTSAITDEIPGSGTENISKQKSKLIPGLAATASIAAIAIFACVMSKANKGVRMPSNMFDKNELITEAGYTIDESVKKIWVFDSDSLTRFLSKEDRNNPSYDDIRAAINDNAGLDPAFAGHLYEFTDLLEDSYPEYELDLRPFYLNIRNLSVEYVTTEELSVIQNGGEAQGIFFPDICKIYINSESSDEMRKAVIPHEIGHMMNNYYGEYRGYTVIRDFCTPVNYGFIIEEGMDSLFVDTLYGIAPDELPYQAVNNYSKLMMESTGYSFADYINGSVEDYLEIFGDRLSTPEAGGYSADEFLNDLANQKKELRDDAYEYDNAAYSEIDDLYSSLYFDAAIDDSMSVANAREAYWNYIDGVQFKIDETITHPDIIWSNLTDRLQNPDMSDDPPTETPVIDLSDGYHLPEEYDIRPGRRSDDEYYVNYSKYEVLIRDHMALDKYLGYKTVDKSKIMTAIDENENIPEKYVPVIKDFVTTMMDYYPGIDMRIFYENIQKMTFEDDSKMENASAGAEAMYRDYYNTLYVDSDVDLSEGSHGVIVFRHELGHAINLARIFHNGNILICRMDDDDYGYNIQEACNVALTLYPFKDRYKEHENIGYPLVESYFRAILEATPGYDPRDLATWDIYGLENFLDTNNPDMSISAHELFTLIDDQVYKYYGESNNKFNNSDYEKIYEYIADLYIRNVFYDRMSREEFEKYRSELNECFYSKHLKNTDYVAVDGFNRIMDEYEAEHFGE